MMVLLVLFGGILAFGGLLAGFDWLMLLFVAGVLLAVRPAAGLLSLVGSKLPWREQLVISFFGIRGMGSIYYLAFARSEEHTSELQSLMRISYAVFCLKKKKQQNTS